MVFREADETTTPECDRVRYASSGGPSDGISHRLLPDGCIVRLIRGTAGDHSSRPGYSEKSSSGGALEHLSVSPVPDPAAWTNGRHDLYFTLTHSTGTEPTLQGPY